MDTETLEHKGMTTFEGTLKRAKEGNALSQNLLGLWILHGDLPEGVEVDEDPFELIRLSAEQGFAAAQYNMGVILETGLGGKTADAVIKGDMRGQLLLAEIYAKDERCYNKDEALYWFCQLSQHESLRTPELIGYAF